MFSSLGGTIHLNWVLLLIRLGAAVCFQLVGPICSIKFIHNFAAKKICLVSHLIVSLMRIVYCIFVGHEKLPVFSLEWMKFVCRVGVARNKVEIAFGTCR